jgi:hypothetical protein
MGSAHPRAAYVASQEGSGNLNKLFKKRLFSCGFEAVVNDGYTIIASINRLCRPIHCEIQKRLAALADMHLPDSAAEEAFGRLTTRSAPA